MTTIRPASQRPLLAAGVEAAPTPGVPRGDRRGAGVRRAPSLDVRTSPPPELHYAGPAGGRCRNAPILEIASLGIACVKVVSYFDMMGNEDDLVRWDSEDTLLKWTGLSRSGLSAAMGKLERHGHIARGKEKRPRGHVLTLYWLLWRFPPADPTQARDMSTPAQTRPSAWAHSDPLPAPPRVAAAPPRPPESARCAHADGRPFLLESFGSNEREKKTSLGQVEFRSEPGPDGEIAQPTRPPSPESTEARKKKVEAHRDSMPPEEVAAIRAAIVAETPVLGHPRQRTMLEVTVLGHIEGSRPDLFPPLPDEPVIRAAPLPGRPYTCAEQMARLKAAGPAPTPKEVGKAMAFAYGMTNFRPLYEAACTEVRDGKIDDGMMARALREVDQLPKDRQGLALVGKILEIRECCGQERAPSRRARPPAVSPEPGGPNVTAANASARPPAPGSSPADSEKARPHKLSREDGRAHPSACSRASPIRQPVALARADASRP